MLTFCDRSQPGGHGGHENLFQHKDILWPVTVVTVVTGHFSKPDADTFRQGTGSLWPVTVVTVVTAVMETFFSTQTFCDRSRYGKFVTGHGGHGGHGNLFQHTDILCSVTVVTETFFSTPTFCDWSRWSRRSRKPFSAHRHFVTGHGMGSLWPVTVVTAVTATFFTETFFSTQTFCDRSRYGKFVTGHGGHGGHGNLFQHTDIFPLWPAVTRCVHCDQLCPLWPPVTSRVHCDPLCPPWPVVSIVTSRDQPWTQHMVEGGGCWLCDYCVHVTGHKISPQNKLRRFWDISMKMCCKKINRVVYTRHDMVRS